MMGLEYGSSIIVNLVRKIAKGYSNQFGLDILLLFCVAGGV